jgi:hypothetical protein
MSHQEIGYLVSLVYVALMAYWFGKWRGALKQRDLWADHMAKGNSYIYAVEDLDRWCGHTSPHAKLIARHLYAQGEGLGCNAGTPNGDEACTVHGLREQLKRLDAASIGRSSDRKDGE